MPARLPVRSPASIRHRLMLLVLAACLPAIAGLALQARTTFLREEQLALENLRQLAGTVNIAIEAQLDQKAVLARTLAGLRSLRERDFAEFEREARRGTSGTDTWVLLVDRTHQQVNTRGPAVGKRPRVPDAPFVSDGPGVFFTMRGPVSQAPAIALFVPEQGVQPPEFNVGIPFPPAAIDAVLARQALPAGGVLAVIDAAQRVMARSRDPQRWIGQHATGELAERAREGQAALIRSTTLDGVASLTYLSAPNRYGWQSVIALPASTLQAAARRLTLQALAVSGVLLLIGLALAWYVARRISAPVLALEQAAADLGAQRVPAPLRTGLAEADRVGAVLHQAGLRSREAGQLLEQRVAEAVHAAGEAQAKLFDARKHEAIGRLTGGVAHDFNNLLQTIQMGLQVLQRSSGGAAQPRALNAALAACAKAAELVRQLLAFGRSQALQPRPVSVADLLLQSQDLTARALGGRILLVADIAADLPPVFADPTQLELALLNLVFNARDAMPGGGTITVRGRRMEAHEAPDARPFVLLQVVDDGPGMDEATLSRAFEPYFTTKPVGAGSGLGLPQVQAFARQSGGEARISSQPGQGTCVTLLLPAAQQQPADPATPAADTPAPAPAALAILMVEDDVLVGSVVPSALQQAGHSVHLCSSADQALVLLQNGAAFDVLFTDIVMPGRHTGLDLVAWAREHRPGMAVLVATGYSAQQPSQEFTVLRKPYAIESLLRALHATQARTA